MLEERCCSLTLCVDVGCDDHFSRGEKSLDELMTRVNYAEVRKLLATLGLTLQ
jgi:hypothetical protein